MYKKTHNDWQKHIDFILLDMLMLIVSVWLAATLRNGFGTFFIFRIYREMLTIVITSDIMYTVAAKPYSGIIYRDWKKECRSVLMQITVITLLFLFYCFILQKSLQMSRLAVGLFVIIASCFMLTERSILKYSIRKRCPASRSRDVLIAAGYRDAVKLMQRFEERAPTGFNAKGIILFGGRSDKKYIKGVPIIARDADTAISYIENNVIDEIIFLDPGKKSYYEQLLSACEVMGLTTHIIIRDKDDLGNTTIETIAGMRSVSSCMRLVSSTDMLIKRLLDILGAVIGLILTGILFLFVAPAIYREDPGPIFFKQTRIGKNGRRFDIYKFRSMYQDAEERKQALMDRNEMQGQIFKIENDPRIIGSGPDGTKKGIGWFIRSYSIDEFPQFWNVLKGDMSLVGTRPPTLDEWEQYEQHHRKRMRVKPGITGLWQISGRSEITDFEEIVALDTKYIREWSLGLDIQIIFKTIKVVLTKSGAK